jgi:hypothetical protein
MISDNGPPTNNKTLSGWQVVIFKAQIEALKPWLLSLRSLIKALEPSSLVYILKGQYRS